MWLKVGSAENILYVGNPNPYQDQFILEYNLNVY